MKLPTRVETFKIGDQGSKNSQIEIIAVHPFKKFHLERDRAHLEKLITAALASSGASTGPKDKPRVSYYAVDPDDFRFGVKSGGTARFVKECQNLAKCVKGLLGKDPSRSDKRLIFLAHGLGAALTKYCLANQYEYHETITKRTAGVAFLDSWCDSGDRNAITDFVNGWMRGPPIQLEASDVQALPSKTRPDNVLDQRRSVQESACKAKEEFIDLLFQVDNNFREIMDPGRQRDFQLAIDGLVFQLQWLGPPSREKISSLLLGTELTMSKRASQKLGLPAPIIRTPSIRKIDEGTRNGLTCIISFLKDTSDLRDDLPPELKELRYFTDQYDQSKMIIASRATHDREISRRARSDSRFRREKDQMPHGDQEKANPEIGGPSPPTSVEAATRRLYQQFVDPNAPSGAEEGEDPVYSVETLGWLATKAASYVELRELDNADKVYEQIIRLRQAIAPGDAYLFVLHLRRAKVWHEMGRYKDAKAYFSWIHDATSSMRASQAMKSVSDSLDRDLEWYRVLSKFRLGEHAKVDQLLTNLTDHYFHPRIVARIINEPSLPWDENIQIVFRCRRILALNKAKMGRYGEAEKQIDELHLIVRKLDRFISRPDRASQQHTRESLQHRRWHSQPTVSKSSNDKQQPRKASALLAYTSAAVFLLRGQHKTALARSREAVELLRIASGADSLDALEARKLEAQLLAYDCKPSEAEVACKESLRCASSNFGVQHPVSMETMDVLVFILRRQARLSEALVTAQGLCRQCDQVLGPEWPQTRQSKSQLASIHLASGNYRDAVNLLQDIAVRSPDEHNSPGTLRYQAELAFALFRLGKFDAAGATIQQAILAQKILFTRAPTVKSAHDKLPTTKFDDELRELAENLRGEPDQVTKYMPHPDLLYSLEVLAHITSRTDLALAVERLELVLTLREASSTEPASDEHTTEKTRSDVILMKRELGAGGYKYAHAERDLTKLTEKLQRILGPYHPDTASARSELFLTRAILGPEPRHALETLSALKRQQKLEVGRAHPDTLRTRLAVLVVQLLLGDEQAASMTCRRLLEALRAPEVRKQRLVEALTMEERIAVLYANQGRFAEFHEILDSTITSLERELAPQVKELGLDDMVIRFKDLLEQIRSYKSAV
ncbi:hypothetical protein SLS63_013489 [Diaporthe eres]|uniref:Uncharacterized protein n=1 Tax=Diaporthe eres TaxID=83184 RepID=A0ABR1NNC8_DIAER